MRLIERRRREKGLRANLARRWGKRDAQGRDPAVLRRAYEIYRKGSLRRDSLDRFTWDDLDMDDVFRRIDHTLTAPGALRLHEILRNPAKSAAVLESRASLIRLYETRPEVRESLLLALARPGYRDPVAISRFLWEEAPGRPAWNHLYPSLFDNEITRRRDTPVSHVLWETGGATRFFHWEFQQQGDRVMAHLTRAHSELYRRSPDEQYPTLEALKALRRNGKPPTPSGAMNCLWSPKWPTWPTRGSSAPASARRMTTNSSC